jgi:putative monooxygenase
VNARLVDPKTAPATDRGRGVRTWPLVTRARGAEAFLSGITEFEAGAGLPLHFHNCQESVVVLEGRAVCQVESDRQQLDPYMTVIIDAGVHHRFENAAEGRLRILWTYGSPRATRTIVATGETFAVED